ncbi:hypothetical protein L2E82_02507 [Cichorium intybus]|uniref:Uncharacterized protein n=1 Tax=Cichorium intybus TaxID=13427 RepID=A0ACB9H1T6_CICIN|nr:hypothetical protein L2E82_02507 [Cichorium intybus]
MGKLGKKAQDKNDIAEEVVPTAELSNGRESESEITMTTSLDALFAEDDHVMVSDDSDSDGYLSEDPSSENLSANGQMAMMDKRTLSINNQKIYEELSKQKTLLDKLKKKDQKFVKFVESYNKNKIDKNQEMYSDEDEIDEGEDLMVLDDSVTTKGKVLIISDINSWSNLVTKENSESALTSLVNAYRAACHLGHEENGFIIQDNETFCKIYTFMLSEADNIFRGLLKIPLSSRKKDSILELKNTPRWKKVKPMVKSYLRSTLFLLKQVTDLEILAFTITRLRASVIFFAAFPSLLNRVIHIVVPLWATYGGTLSASCFLVIEDVVSVFGHLSPFNNLLILRHAKQKENKEAIKKIYSWQYGQCIDMWVQFISTNTHENDIQPLLHIIIDLINGIAHLFPGPRYIPLRTRCIQWLNKLSNSCSIFIPVASLILDMLEYKLTKDGSKSRKSVKLASNLKVEQNVEFFEKGIVNYPFTQYYKSVIEKAATKMSTSPLETKQLKRKKTQAVKITANGDSNITNGNADSMGEEKKSCVEG